MFVITQKDSSTIQESVSFQKWQNMNSRDMRKFAYSHPGTFNRRLRRGVPQQFRWRAWSIWLEFTNSWIHISSELYNLLHTNPSTYRSLILIDIPRSFPLKLDTAAQDQLYRVLNAFANYKPDIGYCQGMSFVAGFILMVSDYNEKEAFEFFCSFMIHWGACMLYAEGFPLLRVYTTGHQSLLKENCEHLYNHMELIKIPAVMYLHHWYLTIFVCTFPLATTAVLWDYLIAEGLHAMITISVGTLKVLQESLLKRNLEDMVIFLKELKHSGDTDEARVGQMLNKVANCIKNSKVMAMVIGSNRAISVPTESDIRSIILDLKKKL